MMPAQRSGATWVSSPRESGTGWANAAATETRPDGTEVVGTWNEDTGEYSLQTTFPEGHELTCFWAKGGRKIGGENNAGMRPNQNGRSAKHNRGCVDQMNGILTEVCLGHVERMDVNTSVIKCLNQVIDH